MRTFGFERVLGGVCAPDGYLASGVSCGIKGNGSMDLALLYSKIPASVAGVFTTNKLAAAPVLVTRERVMKGIARAVVINSGNANALTGSRGLNDALAMAAETESVLGIPEGQALVASTGYIGEYLTMDKVLKGIRECAAELSPGGNTDAAKAIMTTDTYPKELAVEMEIGGRMVRIGAMVKGAGMIHPNLATMICIITTDALIEPKVLSEWLSQACEWSFNRISVDGDQSTNDTVLMLANGASFAEGYEMANEEKELFFRALCWLCGNLAMAIVKDGEGSTKILRIVVNGTRSDGEAVSIARSIANSNLVKCAFHGGLPAWGRIAAAIGASGVDVKPEELDIYLGDQLVVKAGRPADLDMDELFTLLSRDEFEITANVGEGSGSAYFLSCDLSEDYVRFNSQQKS